MKDAEDVDRREENGRRDNLSAGHGSSATVNVNFDIELQLTKRRNRIQDRMKLGFLSSFVFSSLV